MSKEFQKMIQLEQKLEVTKRKALAMQKEFSQQGIPSKVLFLEEINEYVCQINGGNLEKVIDIETLEE